MEPITQDTQTTPQPPTAPVQESPVDAFEESTSDSTSKFSFEDVIYGPKEERAAEPPPQQVEQVQSAPEALETPPSEPQEAYQAKNDEKRFEYWQSQAAKLRNENEQLQNASRQVRQEARYTSAGPVQPQQQAPQQQEEEFPAPPDKPARPRNYSREAAYTDPSSESAAYMDSLDDWRDNMDEYNQIKQEYESARVEEYMQAQEAQRQQTVAQQQRVSQQQRQIGEINEYVQANYGLDNNEAQEFIREYSDPKSVSMENLVQLYRFKKGANPPPPAQPAMPAIPSPAFEQTRRAQQIPSPMGVQSGVGSSNPDDGKPTGQKFMEALIDKHNDSQVF